MGKKMYQGLLITLNVFGYSYLFISGMHMNFWNSFTSTHFGNMMILIFFAFMFVPLRILVYFVAGWGIKPCNANAFIMGIGIFVILHILPIIREVLYYDWSATVVLWILIVTDLMVMTNYIRDDGMQDKSA